MTTLIISNTDAERLESILKAQKAIALNHFDHEMCQRVLDSFNNSIQYKRMFTKS